MGVNFVEQQNDLSGNSMEYELSKRLLFPASVVNSNRSFAGLRISVGRAG